MRTLRDREADACIVLLWINPSSSYHTVFPRKTTKRHSQPASIQV
jgi:hypothetical protein